MNEQQALQRMVAPGQVRRGKYRGGVIQIWVTRACDKACFGCTQASNLRGPYDRISVDQFEQACTSLRDYWGVVGVFGGNPALHPQFDILCKIMQQHIPYEQRGLWCNKLFGHGAICRDTFNPSVSNLNVHLDREAYEEFKRDWPESRPVGLKEDSRHSPPYVAMQDVIEDEGERWKLISNCDINQHWSAMICTFRSHLRAYFCEVAGCMSMLHQHEPDWPDTGVDVIPGWWRKPMEDFRLQVRQHCHRCGVPLRGRGELAQSQEGVEQTTRTHAEVYQPKVKGREVQLVRELSIIQPQALDRFTDYLQNAQR